MVDAETKHAPVLLALKIQFTPVTEAPMAMLTNRKVVPAFKIQLFKKTEPDPVALTTAFVPVETIVELLNVADPVPDIKIPTLAHPPENPAVTFPFIIKEPAFV